MARGEHIGTEREITCTYTTRTRKPVGGDRECPDCGRDYADNFRDATVAGVAV